MTNMTFLIWPALVACLILGIGIALLWLLPKRPEKVILFLIHLTLSAIVLSASLHVSHTLWKFLFLSLFSAFLLHFVFSFTEIFPRIFRRFLIAGSYGIAGLVSLAVVTQTVSVHASVMLTGLTLLIVSLVLVYFLRQPHSRADGVIAASFLIGLWIADTGSTFLSPLFLIALPLSLLIGFLHFRMRHRVAYLVQSEKRVTFGNLLAGLAHEINNPMTFVASNLEPLRESLDYMKKAWTDRDEKSSQVLEKLDQMITDMEEGVSRAQNLIQKIRYLPYEKKEEKEEIDLNRIIDQTMSLLSHKWQGRIRLERRFEDIPKIRGSMGELGQIFTNLIANACEATPDGGLVLVMTHKGQSGVQVTIRDSGKGIPPDMVGRIFDPFFTTKGDEGGTGLGLSITLQLIKNHRGTIEVKSEEGQGTEFLVFLPY